jgi:Toprim domain
MSRRLAWGGHPLTATYHCARCGEQGFARNRNNRTTAPDPARLAQGRAETAERDRAHKARRQQLALWLWRRRRPIAGSIAETYLREARGYGGSLPATLGYLPPWRDHPPSMIAAFGLVTEPDSSDRRWRTLGPNRIVPEPDPGIEIAADAVTGVHLTRLLPDGSGKAEFDDPNENAKIMIGHSAGSPIVLAPMNDWLALAITEGIEDGLSIHQSLGIGLWVAGAASRLPALAEIVPAYTDTVLVFAHDDRDGQRHAAELGRRLRATSCVFRACWLIAGSS